MTFGPQDAQANFEASASMSAEATSKHSFTKQHFRSASFFASSAEDLEGKISSANERKDIRTPQHRAHVVGAIVSAVMGLEACINEVYIDACDESKTNLAGLDGKAMSLLALWWGQIESRPILLKYEHALLLLGRPPFPKGRSPYQDVDHLIHLRNALTHYKPEWDDSLDKHGDLQSRLAGKFDLSPMYGKNALWFPHQCLSSGCAKWAVDTAEAFVKDFCSRLGIKLRI